MSMTNRSAVARAQSMIEVVRSSLALGLAERNKAMAEEYIASLFESGLIHREQMEDLTTEAELAFTLWTMEHHPQQHL